MARNKATQVKICASAWLSVEPLTDGGLPADFLAGRRRAASIRSRRRSSDPEHSVRVGHISFAREVMRWHNIHGGAPERGTLTS